MSAEIERIIPGAPAPEWWDRMWNGPKFRWCDAHTPIAPNGFNTVWGCYRLLGHTGRHMGLASKDHNSNHDAWVIWS